MTTCTVLGCGTGSWTGPLPGDPETASIRLTVSPQVGGLNVRWSMPSVNPQAVAFVRIYRGATNDVISALEIATSGGSTYFDPQNNNLTWFYWIKVVSVHGTESEFIGPATGTSRPLSDDLSDNLIGIIDFDKLDQSLKEPLEQIPFLQNKLLQEIFDRETGETSLADAIQQANNGVASAMTFIGQVNSSLTADNQALAETLRVTAAVLESGISAVTEEIQTEVTRLDGAITAESNLRTQVVADVDGKYATITDNQSARITTVNNRVTSEATRTDQLISNVGGRITGVEQNMTVLADEVDDVYSSAWKVNLQANGLIGSFGLLNDSQTVQAGFDVDEFWIGRTNANKVKPFMIDQYGVTYIDKARIREASIDTLKIESGAVSASVISNYHYDNGEYGNNLNQSFNISASTFPNTYLLAQARIQLPSGTGGIVLHFSVDCSNGRQIADTLTYESTGNVFIVVKTNAVTGAQSTTASYNIPTTRPVRLSPIPLIGFSWVDPSPLQGDWYYTVAIRGVGDTTYRNNTSWGRPRIYLQGFKR